LELSLVIDSLSLKSVWLIWMGVFGGTQIWFWVGDLMMLVVKLMEVYFGSSWLMPWAEL
jgi:hypothetical protein